MNLNLCRLCYRPVLRGVNLSNGKMIHEKCLLAAQKKALDVSSKAGLLANAELTQIYDYFLTYPPDFEERKKQVAVRDGNCCSKCRSEGVLHLHHIQALSNGGTNKLENLTLLCERCHSQAHGKELAEVLIGEGAVPEKCPEDALHIAVASVHAVDLIVTWNFKHINNPVMRAKIRNVVELQGLICPELCSPDEFLGEENE